MFETRGDYQTASTLATELHTELENEVAGITVADAQGSQDYQISLAPILVKVRTTLADVSLISTNAAAHAKGLVETTSTPTILSAAPLQL